MVARDYGLTCSTGYADAGSITDGLNDPANHDAIVRGLEQNVPKAAALGIPQVIAFFGNRRELSNAEGIDNCVTVLERVAPIVESENVTLVVELLNSKVNHPDYQGDRTAFGVEVIKGVGSPRVKLLYDIYHMQVMEGDVIRTIRDNQQYIAHYHTAGRARPARARSKPGAQLAGHLPSDYRHRLSRVPRTRVHSNTGPDDLAPRGRRALRGVNHVLPTRYSSTRQSQAREASAIMSCAAWTRPRVDAVRGSAATGRPF